MPESRRAKHSSEKTQTTPLTLRNDPRYNVAMADANDESRRAQARFEEMFEAIARAMKVAAGNADHSAASSVAEELGLKETSSSASTGSAWQTTASGFTLWFGWRYFDQSHSFRVEKDMNILALELREGDKILRKTEERFED
jgi:hypothetical protein